MASDSAKPSLPKSSQNQKSSPAIKLLVWGMIGLLFLFIAVEASSFQFCHLSAVALNDAIRKAKSTNQANGLDAVDIDRQITGIAFRSEQVLPAPPAANEQLALTAARKWIYRWPSLFGNYRVVVTLNGINQAILVEEGNGFNDSPVQNSPAGQTPASGAAASATGPAKDAPKPIPKEGLAHVYDHTLVLATDEPSIVNTMRKRRLGALAREVIRQAVLIAARDEMGINTLDATMGEYTLTSESPAEFPFHVDLAIQANPQNPNDVKLVIQLSRPTTSGTWFNWTSTPFPVSTNPDLDALVELIEPLSRGDLINGLKQAGFAAATESSTPAVSAPDDFVGRVDFVAQHAMLRQLHSERRAKGETVKNLGALVRAYANLGNLIDFHWSPMSKAFKARALVYAQRMLSKFGETAETRAHRAYAWALAGNHKLALNDIKAARALPNESAPDWLDLIEAFCEFKPAAFETPKQNLDELTAYLRMRMLDPYHERSIAVPAIEDVLRRNLACSRALEQMRETRTLGQVRIAAEGLSDQAWTGIYDRMSQIPDLPSSAKKLAQKHRVPPRGWFATSEHTSRVKLIDELRKADADAGSRAEPSWSALAEMLSDLTFVQSERAVTSSAEWLGLSKDQTTLTVKQLAPLVAGHRFGKFLNFYANDRAVALTGLTELVTAAKSTDFEMHCLPIAAAAYQANPEFYRRMNDHMDNHWDKIDEDVMKAIGSKYPGLVKDGWEFLVEICPNRPLAIARTIHQSPEFEAKAAEWERRYADNGYVMLELGRKYRDIGRYTDGIRCMKKSVEVAPTHENSFDLADEYERVEDVEAAKAVMEAALKLPSYGLEEGNTHRRLAQLMMFDGDWEAAEPHAEAAAETYSGSALQVAAHCAEGLKQWEKAEQLYQAISERYESSGDNWYFACIRMGRGNLVESRILAEKLWKTFVQPFSWNQIYRVGLQQIIDNKPEAAIATLTNPLNEKNHTAEFYLVASVLADQLGDTAKRDALFNEIETKFTSTYAATQLVNLFRGALKDPNKFEWNEYRFHELADDVKSHAVNYVYCCAGEFLANHGQSKLAIEYLSVPATSYDVNHYSCILAGHFLHQKGVPLEQVRSQRFPDDRLPFLRLFWAAARKRNEKQYAESRLILDQALREKPDFTSGLITRGRLSEMEGKFADAAADYEAVLKINPDSETGLALLAQLQSTCPDDSIRNGQKALEHTQRLFELSFVKLVNENWTMAVAQAESGNFAKAIEFQELVLKTDPKNQMWLDQLELYKAGKPYRYTAPETTAPAKNESDAKAE